MTKIEDIPFMNVALPRANGAVQFPIPDLMSEIATMEKQFGIKLLKNQQ